MAMMIDFIKSTPDAPLDRRVRNLAQIIVDYLSESNIQWVRGTAKSLVESDRVHEAGWDVVVDPPSPTHRPTIPLKEYKFVSENLELDREMLQQGWIALTSLLTLQRVAPSVVLASMAEGPFKNLSPHLVLQVIVEMHLSPALVLSDDGKYVRPNRDLRGSEWWWNQVQSVSGQDALLASLGSDWSLDLAGFPLGTTAEEVSQFCTNMLGFSPIKIIQSSDSLWSTGLTVTATPANAQNVVEALKRLPDVTYKSHPIVGHPIAVSNHFSKVDKTGFIANRIILFTYSLHLGVLDAATILTRSCSFAGTNLVYTCPIAENAGQLLTTGLGAIRLKQSVAGQYLRVLSRTFGKPLHENGQLGDVALCPIGKHKLHVRLPKNELEERLWAAVCKAVEKQPGLARRIKTPRGITSRPSSVRSQREKPDLDEELDTVLSKFADTLGLVDREDSERESADVANKYGKRELRSDSPSPEPDHGIDDGMDGIGSAGGPLKEWSGLNFGKCPDKPPRKSKVANKRQRRDVDEIAKMLHGMNVDVSQDDEWEDVE